MPNVSDKSIVPFEKIETSPFQKNTEADRVLKRVERIASAIYLVTNHLSVSETLVQRVRSVTDELISSVLSVKDGLFGNGEQARMSVNGQVRHIIALVRLLHVGGFVSQGNASVLIEALDDLGMSISSGTSLHAAKISREDFAAPVVERARSENILHKDIVEKIKSVSSARGEYTAVPKITIVSETKKRRTQTIMDTLSKETFLGIKDICARFPEYSEKMVQRELAQLVEEGVAKKVGEKRWSKYGLI